jgi:ABC-type Fe3+ transport system permease subunit
MVSSILVRETLDDFTRSQPERLARAAWVSMPLVMMCVLIALVSSWLARRSRIDVGDDEPRGAWGMRGWMRACAIVLSMGSSIGTLLLLARQHSGAFSATDAWRAFGPHVLTSVWHTAMAAGIAALLLAAGLLVRGGWVVLASIGAFLVGGQWIALVWIRMLSSVDGWFFEWMYDTPGAWVMGMLSRFGWIVMAVSMLSWREGGMRLREMARADGASRDETMYWVTGPMTAGAAAAGLLIFAALAMTEVPATVLLQPSGSLVPLMMGWVHIQRYDPLIEVGIVLGGLVLLLGLMSGWLLRRVGR